MMRTRSSRHARHQSKQSTDRSNKTMLATLTSKNSIGIANNSSALEKHTDTIVYIFSLATASFAFRSFLKPKILQLIQYIHFESIWSNTRARLQHNI